MKNRDRQRANRRMKEEMISRRRECGIKDPTPYEAVKNMIRTERMNARARTGNNLNDEE